MMQCVDIFHPIFSSFTFFLACRAASSFCASNSRSFLSCSALAFSLACSSSRWYSQKTGKTETFTSTRDEEEERPVFITVVHLFLQQGCFPHSLSSFFLSSSLLLLLPPPLLLYEMLRLSLLPGLLLCPPALQLLPTLPGYIWVQLSRRPGSVSVSEDKWSPFLLLSAEALLLLSLPLQSGLSPPFSQELGCFVWVISARPAQSMRRLWSFKNSWKEMNPSSKCKQVWDKHRQSISTSTCWSWLTGGHVWQFLLPCLVLLTSGCPDRSGGPGREGRRINTNILLRDWRELQLQWRSRTAADGFRRWTLKLERKRAHTPLSADAWHDSTLQDFMYT